VREIDDGSGENELFEPLVCGTVGKNTDLLFRPMETSDDCEMKREDDTRLREDLIETLTMYIEKNEFTIGNYHRLRRHSLKLYEPGCQTTILTIRQNFFSARIISECME